MTRDEILELYKSIGKTNYDVEFINEQIRQLEESHMQEGTESSAERMYLGIICSALKYYINASPGGFSNNIIDIVRSIERIYNIDALLDDIIDIE